MNTFYKTVIVTWALLCTIKILPAQTYPAGFQAIKLAEQLNPTDMKFSPGGQYLFITDKRGYVLLVEDDVLSDTVLDMTTSLDVRGERGLTHIAIDPSFETNNYVYLYYTLIDSSGTSQKAFNRVGRFVFNGSARTLTYDGLHFDLDPMVGNIHTGGALNFGQDGKLYVATGESSNPLFSQDPNSLLGKVLRLNKDFSIPTDNPFYNVYTGKYRYIYALGFRNPFSADVDPATGKYFICDVGQDKWEEINDVQAGKNYGWNTIEGPKPANVTPPANYKEPVFYYNHATDGCAITGAAFYNPANVAFPSRWVNKFFYGDYCNQYIRVFDPVTGQFDTTFASGLGNPVSFAVRPSGEFYYLDRGGDPYGQEIDDGVLWKVVYTGSLAPVIGAQPKTLMVSVGASATFGLQASGLNLTYEWFKNGVAVPNSNGNSITFNNVQLADSGAVITCIVTNPQGADTSTQAILKVTQRQGPTPEIVTPALGDTYVAGQVLAFSGGATDAVEGPIPASRLTWQIDFHHDTHWHPGMDATSGISSGSFTIPTIGEVSDTVWFRVYLTAENDLGIKTTIYKDVYPQKVALALRATAAGIALNVDGSTRVTPIDVLSVKNVVRTITAPTSYMLEDTLFTFAGWGGGQTNPQVIFPTSQADTVITANYDKFAVFDGTGLMAEYRKSDENFVGAVTYTRVDPVIDFNWPADPAPGVGNDNFTVRWKGSIMPRITGLYTFYLASNQYGRLYINDQLIINRWGPQSTTETSGNFAMDAGVKYNIRVEMWGGYGASSVALRWSGPSLNKQLVATSSLFAQEAVLPVIFRDFNVRPRDNKLTLSWTVEDLGNVKGYTVERRKAGGSYEAIAFIPANGSGTYTYTDASVLVNTLYEYRIRQEELNGSPRYSLIRVGRLSSKLNFDFTILPNPVTTSTQVKLLFNTALATADISLASPDGKIVFRQQLAASGQTIDLYLPGVAAGTYYLKVRSGKEVSVKKLVVR